MGLRWCQRQLNRQLVCSLGSRWSCLGHWSVVVGRSAWLGLSALGFRLSERPAYYGFCRYFPRISFNFSFVDAGIFVLSVRIAFASADPHLHERALGIAPTVAFTTLAAFSAFLTSTPMICST